MEFSSLFFIYVFLPLTAAVYFLIPGVQRKNIVLIAASLFFYAVGQPVYLLLLLGLSYVNYIFGTQLTEGKRSTLVIAAAINIFALALFKYLDFFLGIFGIHVDGGVLLTALKSLTQSLNSLLGTSFRAPSTALPLGISFYTFQSLAYLIDIYRSKSAGAERFSKYLLYICMFPKMAQGPIVRYEQLAPQLEQRRTNPRMIFDGIFRFATGLAKKVLLADYAGKVISDLAKDPSGLTVVGAWLSALMFMFQIYFDFSGYTDMAIGIGRIFGFRYPENFDLPYVSTSITEFWRRWHMTLGSFFRDYVYIPLGGNRKGKGRQILNLLAVWALTGLWHGASWNFVLWGLYFFALLAIEKQILPKLERLPFLVRNLVTMFFVLIGWVLFSHTSLAEVGKSLGAMFGGAPFSNANTATRLSNSLPLLLVCGLGASVLPRWFGFVYSGLLGMGKGNRRVQSRVTAGKAVYVVSQFVFVALLLWLCTVSLLGTTSSPSIYANF